MSSYCYIQDCPQYCCNIDGVCPTAFGSINQTNCYYQYYWSYYIWGYWWMYFAVIFGALVFLSIFIGCIVACVRRRRRFGQDTIVVETGSPSYVDQGMIGYGNMGYGVEMGRGYGNQPVMGEPVYLVSNKNTGLLAQPNNLYIS